VPRRAVFLDRDGVLNRLILNPATGAFESPHRAGDLLLTPGAGAQLTRLRAAGYLLFLVSNQPSYAKGKASLEALQAVHQALEAGLAAQGAGFDAVYYCYHHPDAVVPELKGPCACRKPAPQSLLDAIRDHRLDPAACWMVGDQDSDMGAGRAAGVRTALVLTPESAAKRGASDPDLRSADLAGAVQAILLAS
jgi:D-glycero-D-manno-heptose 1,7-bisphosphate phosphatase